MGQKAQKRAVIGQKLTSVNEFVSEGALRDDILRVTVRSRPVGERRERFLVKLCERQEKIFDWVTKLHPSRSHRRHGDGVVMMWRENELVQPTTVKRMPVRCRRGKNQSVAF